MEPARQCGTQKRSRSPNMGGGFRARTGRNVPSVIPMSIMLEETRDQPEALSQTLESGLRAMVDLRDHFGSSVRG